MSHPKILVPNHKHNTKVTLSNKNKAVRSRKSGRAKTGPTSSKSKADKSEAGFSNSFIPALIRARFHGKLRYGAASLNFTATTGLVGTYVFTANGLFDPNITGGSLQPAGFQQLMSLYEHYVVSSSRISVLFTNNSTQPCIVGIALEPDVTASTDPANMLELPYEQVVQLEPAGVYGSTKTLSMSASMSKYFGVNVNVDTALYRGDSLSNPQEQAYFHLKTYGLKGASSDVFFQVKIESDAWFTEPRELSPSLQKSIFDLVTAEEKAAWTMAPMPTGVNCMAQVVRPHK